MNSNVYDLIKSNLPKTGVKQIRFDELEPHQQVKTLGYINGQPLESVFVVGTITKDQEIKYI